MLLGWREGEHDAMIDPKQLRTDLERLMRRLEDGMCERAATPESVGRLEQA